MHSLFLFPGRCPSSRSWVYSGSFSSPYYPSSYARHSWACSWVITVPSGYRVKLEFHTFDLGARGYDYLEIYDGSSYNSRYIGYYDGHFSACTVYSTGTSLWLEFRSYSWNVAPGKGFYATYTAVSSYSKYNIRLSKLALRGL